jgi:protocatechuate 3,4-dioxygenase beta subunit
MRWHAAALLLLLATAAPRGAVDTGVISGSVVDGDRVPLTGATVYLLIEKGGCPSVVTRTDATGRFEFREAQPGSYRVRAEKTGYLTQMLRQEETGPAGFGRSIVLTPSHLQEDVQVVLPRAAATVSGTVYGEDGKPLPNGGWVFFEDEQHHDVGTTGLPKGRYSVSNLPRGHYYLSAQRYSPEAHQAVGERWYYPDTVNKNDATLVALEDTPTNVDIHFGQQRPPAVTIRVQTDRGLPLVRAEVYVERRGDRDPGTGQPLGNPPWELIQALRTDADGVATLRGLRPGNYCAFLAKAPPPFSSWRNADAPSTSLGHYAKSFRFAGEEAPVHLQFIVAPGLTLEGRFRMRDGTRPRAHGVTIDLVSAPVVGGFRGNMSFRVEPRQLDDVQFAFEGLSPQEHYTVREFDADPLKAVVIVGLWMNGAPLRGDDLVASPVDAPHQLLDVVLDRAGAITGTITDNTTGRVTAHRVSGGVPAALFLNAFTAEIVDGRFALRGLPPGRYDLAVQGRTAVRRVRVEAGEVIDLVL